MRGFWTLFRSRLSQRIVFSVFTSIVIIEAVILIPSIYRRKQERLERLRDVAEAHLQGALSTFEAEGTRLKSQSAKAIFERIRRVNELPDVVGGTLYSSTGQEIDRFGAEPPELGFAAAIASSRGKVYRRDRRYDARWEMSPLDGEYVLVIRHDTTSVQQDIQQFVIRIAWLVVIISGGVTLATLVILQPLLIEPVLSLRNDLLRAAPAALEVHGREIPEFSSHQTAHREDELGEVIGAFQEMFDQISQAILERRAAEQSLRESEARFRAVVDQAAETILVLDRNGQILDTNAFALKYLGYEREELIGKSVFELNPAFNREKYEAYIQAIETGEPVTTETIHRRKNGQTSPVEVRSGLIRMDGEQRILSLVRDISARKEAEKATARLAEIGELAAMIVHEVRNPLATVFMALTGFQRMELPPAGQLRLELALEESERLQRLLNEILAYSREQRLAESEEIELNPLFEELRRTLSQLPQAKEREIWLEPCSTPVKVRGDRDKLKQVFINLISNACEAISAGERVTWTLEIVSQPAQAAQATQLSPAAEASAQASQAAEMPQVTIRVHNGGEAIPPDVLPKLTQPFVSTKPTGNGLGLAITKRIVEAHGGQLTIASSAETGTTVTVVLPASSFVKSVSL